MEHNGKTYMSRADAIKVLKQMISKYSNEMELQALERAVWELEDGKDDVFHYDAHDKRICEIIGWLKNQRREHGNIDVRITEEWMELNAWGFYDPDNPNNSQWVKDKLGNIKKPFVVLSPASCEYDYDTHKTTRYRYGLSPDGMKIFCQDILDKIAKIKTGETNFEKLEKQIKTVIERMPDKRPEFYE